MNLFKQTTCVWYFFPNKIHSINFLVKFMNFDPLLSPCAWLVKWHKCISVNYVIMGITEKFDLFYNFKSQLQYNCPGCFEIICALNI